MAALLYRLINPPVKRLLRSRFHGVMSRNTLLLEFTGRKTGRALSTPISYHLQDGAAHCFTNREFGWWRNIASGQAVRVTIRGEQWSSTPQVESEDHQAMASQLDAFLRAVPRDASHAGVSMDKEGNPDAGDIQAVIPGMVYLRFPLEQKQ